MALVAPVFVLNECVQRQDCFLPGQSSADGLVSQDLTLFKEKFKDHGKTDEMAAIFSAAD